MLVSCHYGTQTIEMWGGVNKQRVRNTPAKVTISTSLHHGLLSVPGRHIALLRIQLSEPLYDWRTFNCQCLSIAAPAMDLVLHNMCSSVQRSAEHQALSTDATDRVAACSAFCVGTWPRSAADIAAKMDSRVSRPTAEPSSSTCTAMPPHHDDKQILSAL